LEREGISVNLQQTEDWLYEEGDDETEVVYSSKLEDLKKVNKKKLANISYLF
jgi:heat shock 70kDa protein 4